MSREIIDNLASNSKLEAEKHFANSISDKVGKAWEGKRRELSSTFVNQEAKKDEENWWTLSKLSFWERWT